MADEVPDYMSAEFVTEKKMTKEEQRRAKLKRKRTPKDQIKPAKEIQRERLEEGLLNPIDATNKGYQLLLKMGFKKDEGIGLTNKQKNSDPLPLCIKSDRSGIGSYSAEKEGAKFDPKKQKVTEEKVDNFKKVLSNKLQDKKVVSAIHKVSSHIINLDEQAGKDPETNPLLADWFMTERIREEARVDPHIRFTSFEDYLYAETPVQRFDRLEALLHYLRETYFYCFYCGSGYDSLKQLLELCPGFGEEEH